MNPFADFDRIYVINLPERQDRRREIELQLRRIGLSLEDDPVRLFAASRPKEADGFDSIGARGCFMSHLGALQDALAAGHRRIAIFEDDLDFVPDFDARIGAATTALRSEDWAMFYGGHRLAESELPGDAAVAVVPVERPVVTSHFVAFRQPAIGLAADYLAGLLTRPAGHPDGGRMHVDGAYSWFRRTHPALRTLAVRRPLGVQRPSRTDIHALKWFDAWPVIRDLAGWGRRLRQRRP